MSIADKLTTLNSIKNDIKSALTTQGQPGGDDMNEYAEQILAIEGGGAAEPIHLCPWCESYQTGIINSELFQADADAFADEYEQAEDKVKFMKNCGFQLYYEESGEVSKDTVIPVGTMAGDIDAENIEVKGDAPEDRYLISMYKEEESWHVGDANVDVYVTESTLDDIYSQLNEKVEKTSFSYDESTQTLNITIE